MTVFERLQGCVGGLQLGLALVAGGAAVHVVVRCTLVWPHVEWLWFWLVAGDHTVCGPQLGECWCGALSSLHLLLCRVCRVQQLARLASRLARMAVPFRQSVRLAAGMMASVRPCCDSVASTMPATTGSALLSACDGLTAASCFASGWHASQLPRFVSTMTYYGGAHLPVL